MISDVSDFIARHRPPASQDGTLGVLALPKPVPPSSFCFATGDQKVTFYPDGRVVYDGTPDEAARVFWQAVETLWPADWKWAQ